jgi:hypothetical protein
LEATENMNLLLASTFHSNAVIALSPERRRMSLALWIVIHWPGGNVLLLRAVVVAEVRGDEL